MILHKKAQVEVLLDNTLHQHSDTMPTLNQKRVIIDDTILQEQKIKFLLSTNDQLSSSLQRIFRVAS